MPEPAAPSPILWPIAELTAAYRRRVLSPAEVAEEAIRRVDACDPLLNAFLARLDDLARRQAAAAERAYAKGGAGPLAGVPLSIKDTFPLAGAVTTFGSAVYRDHVTARDSGTVRRLRRAGAVFVGKTNTAEFGQSATTENRLGGDCRNPWDPRRTPGGSSGGAAASVAAGLASAALAADGGGSIRIPAAFTGLFGIKPTAGLCRDEGGLKAMTDFVAPGPLAWRVADARAVLGVLAATMYTRRRPKRLRVAWCPRPEGRPVDEGLAAAVARAVEALAALGHHVVETDLPLAGWEDAFGPLVLATEARERGHLLLTARGRLSDYERRSLEAALSVNRSDVRRARRLHAAYRQRVDSLFESHDILVTPATAVPAFPVGKRPARIAGRPVDWLWGAFPFAAPFNVAGNPAAALPCGLAGSLPVAVQLVARRQREDLLLDLAEELEEAVAFPRRVVQEKWATPPGAVRAAS